MNKPQFITTPGGEQMVILPRSDYDELLRIAQDAAEDAADAAIYDARMADPLGSERLPAEVSAHIVKGTGLLKAFRLWRGLGQVELAAAIGTSQGFISDLEHKRRKMTEEVAGRLAAALDIPVHWLI